MDNVTHSLAGLVLAESITRLRARSTTAPSPAALGAVTAVASIVAANFPDADLFYSGVGGSRLRVVIVG